MRALQIQKSTLAAAVRLDGGGLIAGRFFVDGEGEATLDALLRLLNDTERSFFPLANAKDDGIRFIARAHVDVVWPTESVTLANSITASARVTGATLDYGDGALTGDVLVGDLHPDRRRLLDALNDARPFLVLCTDERTYLVNKARIRSAHVGAAATRSAA
jgi:hypothetical protein